MKTYQNVGSPAGTMARWLVSLLSMAAPVCFSSVASDGQNPGTFQSEVSRSSVTTMPAFTVDEAQSAKTHTLFMGADIALNLDKDVYKIRDVWGSNWVVEINGREREISANRAPLNLKITPTLKLTENSVTIVGFKRVQAYSYANDPSVLLTKGLSQSASMSSDLMAVASNAQAKLDVMVSRNMGAFSVFAGSDDQFSANALMATAQYDGAVTHPSPPGQGLVPSSAVPTTSTNTTGFNYGGLDAMAVNVPLAQTASAVATRQTENGNEPAGKIATGGLDAMDVEFDVRSSKPLQNPYAQSLHPIDEHLSHVHFVEEGFPFDYELIDFQLHIYNRGEEIATNVAADRVELTREEAFEYVKSEYIGAHPKDTLPATPAMARLPADLPAKLAQNKYAGTFYVKVSKDGLADEAYSDPACTQRINDPYLDSVVKRVRFKPALNNGKPVDGVAMVNLHQIPI
jgi:hypothetical protein